MFDEEHLIQLIGFFWFWNYIHTFQRHHQSSISSMLKITHHSSQSGNLYAVKLHIHGEPNSRHTAEKGSLNQVKNQNNLLSPNKFRDKLTFLLGDNMVFWLLNFSHICMNMNGNRKRWGKSLKEKENKRKNNRIQRRCYDWQKAFSISRRIRKFFNKQTIIKLIGTMEENFDWQVNRKEELKKLRQFSDK